MFRDFGCSLTPALQGRQYEAANQGCAPPKSRNKNNMPMKKKTFDAVATMREARKRLAQEWQDEPRKEETDSLRRKYGSLTRKRKGMRGRDREATRA